MDKLEPVLRHKFWILVTLILPMAIYGYFSANSAIKADTGTREEALGKVLGSVPGGKDISPAYSEELSKINEAYEKSIDGEVVRLWQNQQPRMVWPEQVASKVPRTFMGDIPVSTNMVYKANEYERVLEKLIDSVEPVVSQADQKTWEGRPQKVWLSGWIPEMYLGPPQAAPTSKEVWEAQMDVWFTQLMFDAIRAMNDGKDSITESVIRHIDKVQLVGGDGTPVLGGGGGAGGGMGMSSEYSMPENYSPNGMMGGQGGKGISTKVEFNPAQEFGLDGSSTGASMSMSSSAEYDPSGGGFGSPAASAATKTRYIAETEDAPYLERGFYLNVIMMEKKIPDFVVQLANSPWPVRIVRFHIGPNPYIKSTPAGGGFPFGNSLAGPGSSGAYDSDALMSQAPESIPDSGAMESGAYGSSGMGAFGGFGASSSQQGNAFSEKLKARYQKSLPDFTQQAMNHSDLVQVHLCGVITFYKQPPAEAEQTAGETGAAVDAALPEMTPEEKAAQQAENEAAAKAAAEAAAAAADPNAAPGDSTAPPAQPTPETPQPSEPAPPDPAAPSVESPATETPANPESSPPAEGTPPEPAASNS